MGTLMATAKWNMARISNIANVIELCVNQARSHRITITWDANIIYCRICGKKESRKMQYKEISKEEFEKICKRLKEKGFRLRKKEILELDAFRMFFTKPKNRDH